MLCRLACFTQLSQWTLKLSDRCGTTQEQCRSAWCLSERSFSCQQLHFFISVGEAQQIWALHFALRVKVCFRIQFCFHTFWNSNDLFWLEQGCSFFNSFAMFLFIPAAQHLHSLYSVVAAQSYRNIAETLNGFSSYFKFKKTTQRFIRL